DVTEVEVERPVGRSPHRVDGHGYVAGIAEGERERRGPSGLDGRRGRPEQAPRDRRRRDVGEREDRAYVAVENRDGRLGRRIRGNPAVGTGRRRPNEVGPGGEGEHEGRARGLTGVYGPGPESIRDRQRDRADPAAGSARGNDRDRVDPRRRERDGKRRGARLKREDARQVGEGLDGTSARRVEGVRAREQGGRERPRGRGHDGHVGRRVRTHQSQCAGHRARNPGGDEGPVQEDETGSPHERHAARGIHGPERTGGPRGGAPGLYKAAVRSRGNRGAVDVDRIRRARVQRQREDPVHGIRDGDGPPGGDHEHSRIEGYGPTGRVDERAQETRPGTGEHDRRGDGPRGGDGYPGETRVRRTPHRGRRVGGIRSRGREEAVLERIAVHGNVEPRRGEGDRDVPQRHARRHGKGPRGVHLRDEEERHVVTCRSERNRGGERAGRKVDDRPRAGHRTGPDHVVTGGQREREVGSTGKRAVDGGGALRREVYLNGAARRQPQNGERHGDRVEGGHELGERGESARREVAGRRRGESEGARPNAVRTGGEGKGGRHVEGDRPVAVRGPGYRRPADSLADEHGRPAGREERSIRKRSPDREGDPHCRDRVDGQGGRARDRDPGERGPNRARIVLGSFEGQQAIAAGGQREGVRPSGRPRHELVPARRVSDHRGLGLIGLRPHGRDGARKPDGRREGEQGGRREPGRYGGPAEADVQNPIDDPRSVHRVISGREGGGDDPGAGAHQH